MKLGRYFRPVVMVMPKTAGVCPPEHSKSGRHVSSEQVGYRMCLNCNAMLDQS